MPRGLIARRGGSAEACRSPWTRKRGVALKNHLIWIDLEMTGIDPEKYIILEIATVVTDENLELLAEGPDIAISHPKEIFFAMDEWSRSQHKASGLTERTISPVWKFCLAGSPISGQAYALSQRIPSLSQYRCKLNQGTGQKMVSVPSSFQKAESSPGINGH
jgi:hypothetical protein